MKLAVLVDNGSVQRFALDALDSIDSIDEISVFSCTNTRTRRRWLRHGAYYLLNLLSVRNRLTRSIHVSFGKKRVAEQVNFQSLYDGAWQVLPPHVVETLIAGEFDAVLKFGMGLLRVPPANELPIPILSYHHGDPSIYRGRPAGFWEMMEGAPVMGQMVQVIGDRLDSGLVAAYAETKVIPWSYRSTLVESYRHSPLIMGAAISNALNGTFFAKECQGRNYRLPSNTTVAVFIARMAGRFASRLLYGIFFEKRWRVSTAPVLSEAPSELLSEKFPRASTWRHLPVAPRYTFYADPFFCENPRGILVEALRRTSGCGDIVLIAGDEHRTLSAGAGHMSYPGTVQIGECEYVVPETAQWSEPLAYTIGADGLNLRTALRIEGNPRLVDPTIAVHENRLYLFGNIRSVGTNALYLWTSDALESVFKAHPASPIRISPKGARMAGHLIKHRNRLIRLGQDFSHGYGNGLILFEVETLNKDAYLERPIGTFCFRDRRGPHTLNFREREVVFDWYLERFTPLAGWRRFAAKVAARLASNPISKPNITEQKTVN